MRRGVLRRGVAVAALLAALGDFAGARAGSFAPPPVAATAVSIGAAARWVPVCGRGRPIGSGNWDASDSFVFDVSACTVPANVAVRALRLSYMGSDVSNVGEIARAVTMTGSAAVALPSTQFSAVVSQASPAGATSLGVQVAMGSTGNALDIGMGVQGTGIPSGSVVTSITPTLAGNNVTALAFTFSNGSATATTAAIPAGEILTLVGRNHQASFGGARTVTILPSRRFYDSDPIGISLAAGAQFFVRGSWSASAPGFFVGDYPSPASGSSRLAGEGSQRTTSSLGDHTMDQTVPSNSGGGYFAPWTVLGQVTGPTASVLVVGDSIAAGSGDLADSFGHMGYVQRSLGQAVPFASLARGSTTALQMSANLQLVQQAAAEIGATDVLLEYGRNDINATGNPQTAAVLESTLRTIAAPLIASGYRVWIFTIPPTTDSTDGWSTAAGQFLQATSVATTAASTAGSPGAAVTLTLASTAGISTGEYVGPQNTNSLAIPVGTTVTDVGSSTSLTIAPPAGASIGAIASGMTLAFGVRTASASVTPIETQRTVFNAWARSSAPSAAGFAGVIDDDAILEDPANPGLWRTDLGAASLDGIHPAPALHSAAVSAGVISPSMFLAR